MIHVFMVYTLKGCERSCSSYTGVGFYPCFHCCLRAYGILRSWQSYYCKATMRILSSDKYRSSSFFAMPLSAVDAAWYFFGCVITIGFRYLLYSFTFRFTICSLSVWSPLSPKRLVAIWSQFWLNELHAGLVWSSSRQYGFHAYASPEAGSDFKHFLKTGFGSSGSRR